jgi:hypothetical protein
MEFIMTYGWAILVVLVMVGALAYFGVLNPTNLLPERCTLPAGFHCRDFRISDSSGQLRVQMTVENKQGEAISLSGYNMSYTKANTIYYKDQTSAAPCTVTPALASPVPADSTVELDCNLGPSSSPGRSQNTRVLLTLTYQEVNGVYSKAVQGEMQGKVQ